jgi:hypothetical protein
VFPAQPTSPYPHQQAPATPGQGQGAYAQMSPGQVYPGQPGAVPQPPAWLQQNPGQSGFQPTWQQPTWQPDSAGYVDPYGTPAALGPARSRTGLKIVGGFLVLLLVSAIAGVVKGGAGKLLDAMGIGGSSYPTATAPAGVSATSEASARPTGPFEGTPAAQYAEGDLGITLPAGTAVPGFTAAQVNTRLQQVKRALVASRLDPAMLMSHDPNPLLKLLSPEAAKEIKSYFDTQKFFGFATQVAPGYTLTADKVRVSGRVTFRGNTSDGVRLLEVITNFVWVYPFAGALREPGDHLVIVHDEVSWAIPVEADVNKNYRGLRVSAWDAFASNMDCDLLKKSLLGLGKPQPVTASTADDNSAFDPSRSLNVTSTC